MAHPRMLDGLHLHWLTAEPPAPAPAPTPAAPAEPEPVEPEPVDDMHPADRQRMEAVDRGIAARRLSPPHRDPDQDVRAAAFRRLELLGRLVAARDDDAAWGEVLEAVDKEVRLSHKTNI